MHVEQDDKSIVRPLVNKLIAFGAREVEGEAVNAQSALPLPDRIVQALRTSHYAVVLVSQWFPIVSWPALDHDVEALLRDHVVIVLDGVVEGALRRMSPVLTEFEIVHTSGGIDAVAWHLVSILKADARTFFKRDPRLHSEQTAIALLHAQEERSPPALRRDEVSAKIEAFLNGSMVSAQLGTTERGAEGEALIAGPDADMSRQRGAQRIGVFVSSTFRDMHAERELLAKFVFPQLRARCAERGLYLGEVDLRWGITEEQARSGDLLPRCLTEIDRCRPYFLGFLGERYGWVPEHLNEDLFARWPFLREMAGRSITDIEITYGALDQDADTRALFFFRQYAGSVNLHAEQSEVEVRLRALKARIEGSGAPVTPYETPEIGAYHAMEQLWRLLERDLPRSSDVGVGGAFEILSQEGYLRTLVDLSIERHSYLARIDSQLSCSKGPLLVTGEAGSGKSVLLAQWVQRRRTSHPDDIIIFHSSEASPVSGSAASLAIHILTELEARLAASDRPPESHDFGERVERLVTEWRTGSGQRGAPIVVLDGVEGFYLGLISDDEPGLPDGLATICRLLVSSADSALPRTLLDRCSPDLGTARLARTLISAGSCTASYSRGSSAALIDVDEDVITLTGLTESERRLLASTFLLRYGKRLGDEALALIVQAEQTASPRYLITLLDELRIYGSHETLVKHLSRYLSAATLTELYDRILERLESDHEIDRPHLVKDAMSLIWAARRGITEQDLLSLLGSAPPPLPVASWAPVRLSLRDALHMRFNRLRFANLEIKEAVRRRYLERREDTVAVYRRMATFYVGNLQEMIGSDPGIEEELSWLLREVRRSPVPLVVD